MEVATSVTPRSKSDSSRRPQDHRIADITDKKLVETKHARFGRDVGGDAVERVLRLGDRFKAPVHVTHHPVEMNTFLAGHVQCGEKQIHEECFAAADATPEIHAANRWLRPVPREAEYRSRPVLPPLEPLLQLLQAGDDGELIIVGNHVPLGEETFVFGPDCHTGSAIGQRAYLENVGARNRAVASIAAPTACHSR